MRTPFAALAIAAFVMTANAFATTMVQAMTWYADAARPDDSGDGLSWPTAKRTIGAAIAASGAGDTLLVKYGTYAITDALVLSSNRCLGSDDGSHNDWNAATPDSSQCTIQADQTCRVMSLTGTAVSALTVVRGFTLTGGDATSESDPNNGYGGGVDISNGADPIIERCRITGNLAGHTLNGRGGGISVRGTLSSPEIRNCRIDANIGSSAWFAWGGGLFFDIDTAPNVHDCVISGNFASIARLGNGGGVASQSTLSPAAVRDCQITGNIAATLSSGVGGNGGGVYISAGTLVVERCTITGNMAAESGGAQGTGGGICVSGGGITIQILNNPAISGNTSSSGHIGYGGGIYTTGATLIQGNVIEENHASTSTGVSRFGAGGGVHLTGTNGRLIGNVIKGNTASLHGAAQGGGVFFESTNTLERNTIWNNLACPDDEGYGGGVYTGAGGSSNFRSNTLFRNASSHSGRGAGSGFYHASGGSPTVENNLFAHHDVAGSDGFACYSAQAMTVRYNGFHASSGAHYNPLVTSQNETIGDPRFVNESVGDFTLSHNSPDIESGNPSTAVPTDGGWRVDLGAIEYTGTRHLRAITGPGLYLFGGRVKARVNVTATGTVNVVDMVVYPGEGHPWAPGAIDRWYAIAAAGTGATFDLTLSYQDGELGGADEAGLAAWRFDGVGWQGPKFPAAADSVEDWITVNGQTAFGDWTIADAGGATGIGAEAGATAPASLALAPIRPNPCRGEAGVVLRLPHAARVRLAIYDSAGRLVRVLVDGTLPAGEHATTWDGIGAGGRTAPAGVYLCELRAGPERRVAKLLRIP